MVMQPTPRGSPGPDPTHQDWRPIHTLQRGGWRPTEAETPHPSDKATALKILKLALRSVKIVSSAP